MPVTCESGGERVGDEGETTLRGLEATGPLGEVHVDRINGRAAIKCSIL